MNINQNCLTLLNEMSSQYEIYDCEALVVLMDSISIYDLIISLNPIWMRFSQLFDKNEAFLLNLLTSKC